MLIPFRRLLVAITSGSVVLLNDRIGAHGHHRRTQNRYAADSAISVSLATILRSGSSIDLTVPNRDKQEQLLPEQDAHTAASASSNAERAHATDSAIRSAAASC